MTIRQITRGFATIALAIAMAAAFCPPARAQQPPPPSGPPATNANAAPETPASSAPVIRAESRVVRVDVIVTDKKGNYVHDLTAKDFRVFDNDKEQQIVNFSFGSSESASQTPERHYMVLFFDDSTMDFANQAQARQAALKFIDANAGPDRVMAVVDFTGALRIIQNFTGDAAQLKRATEYAKSSAVSPNDSDSSSGGAEAGAPMPSLFNTGNDFGVHTLLLAIRSLAKDLAAVPGRKSVVLFTEGFPMTPDAADRTHRDNLRVQSGQRRDLSARRSRTDGADAHRHAAFPPRRSEHWTASRPRCVSAARRSARRRRWWRPRWWRPRWRRRRARWRRYRWRWRRPRWGARWRRAGRRHWRKRWRAGQPRRRRRHALQSVLALRHKSIRQHAA